MDKVLITGGCGFVGRHFVTELIHRGHDVTVVDDLSTGLRPGKWPTLLNQPNDGFRFIEMDAREYFATSRETFDLIIHLAAVVGGRMTIEGDPLKVATDLAIDAAFFNWLPKLAPAPALVLNFSSSAAYPIAYQTLENPLILKEDMIDLSGANIGIPDMTYGWAKLTSEFLAGYCVTNYGLNVVSYRPFSGYGEDQDLSYPFPRIVKRVMDRENPMVVWGSGNQSRDFIHIDDVVRIVLETMTQLEPGNAMNLSSGIGTSFFELARKVQIVAGVELELRNDPTKPEGVYYRVGDNSLQSRYSSLAIDLDEGVSRTLHYLSEST